MSEINSSLSKLAKYEQNKQIKSVDTCFLWPNSYRIDLTYSNILDKLEVENANIELPRVEYARQI